MTDWSSFDPAAAISNSNFELVVLRYPSSHTRLAEELQLSGLRSWIADTLLYYAVDVSAVKRPDSDTSVTPVANRSAEFDSLLDVIFQGYENHYASSSCLRAIDIGEAYSDWIRNQISSGVGGCYAYRNAGGALAGLGVIESSSEDTSEWTLGGVHPSHRGHGDYAQIIRHMAKLTADQGKSRMVTSTQTSNVTSMRAWCREGLLPILSVNTLHVLAG